jgi:protein O-mannosyl-transferase
MKDSDKKEEAFDGRSLAVSKKLPGSSFGILFFLIAASFLIYLPVIDRYFVSDDFKVLNRVCLENVIFIKRFFRPVSDISIYINYQLGGLNPLVFNSFNILIHGINGYLVYLVCLCFGNSLEKNKRIQFAIISSVIFICYPFHNEAVVWILGRGASMACLFSLLSLLCYYKIKREIWKITGVCSFYFIGMSAFESTVFFPLIFILILIFEKENARSIRKWMIYLVLTFSLQMLLRYRVAGSILGSYGQDFFHSGMKIYILNIAKVGGRLILPPSESALKMTAIFITGVSLALFFILKNRYKISHSLPGKMILYLTGMLFISCIIPVITGVSTQTSETDRTLYFPSLFLCMIAGLLISYCVKKPIYRSLILVLILVYNIFFLEKNNLNWRKASSITFSILEKINEKKPISDKGRIFFLNIPNEVNGAYVFRLGFPDALKLYGSDTSRSVAVNYLPRQDLEKLKEKTMVDPKMAAINIPPDIVLQQDSLGCREIIEHGILKYTCLPGDHIYFWNIDNLESIQACSARNPG